MTLRGVYGAKFNFIKTSFCYQSFNIDKQQYFEPYDRPIYVYPRGPEWIGLMCLLKRLLFSFRLEKQLEMDKFVCFGGCCS